ncbi:ATP-binding protein [Micromonospora sp. NPDC049891]|uniref:ATP-binding protein n=1 Tax=Micromonospora sp. NPDC049891 TaxID=3155655 RepID=UPI0034092F59
MDEERYQLRPHADHFERFGAQISVVDLAGTLSAARTGAVPLLDSTAFPTPVRQVRCTLRAQHDGGRPGYRFEAEIRTGPAHPLAVVTANSLLGVLVGPAGLLLARRLARTRPGADKALAGVGRVAVAASHRLGISAPAPLPDGMRATDPAGIATLGEAAELGLRTDLQWPAPGGRGEQRITMRVAMPGDAVTPASVNAAFGVVLQAVREIVGDGPDPRLLRGHRYVLGRPPELTRPLALPDSGAVTLDQVGGLDEVVTRFREIAVSFRHPEVLARWGARRPQGILLYGPAGTGKTMLARALANEIGAEFREIRTPEILDKWLGGSERNIKRIFREARRWREPTVLLFDEFDSIISYAGAGGDAASQAVNAVAGIFKQEMNTLVEENPNVIVVATTNFPQRVDASLVRSGRFDVKLAIAAPDETGRADIFVKMLRNLVARYERPGFRLVADDIDVQELAALSAGFTGADIRELLRRVQFAKAMREAVGGVSVDPITQSDLRAAIATLR